ncbi:undecaprenyldiphospho-muramoylpentapeptide beta-N-acetylglucosaminyltransferase [Hyphobacterium sp. HN65]|uniref:UDP-N-acetylglucosamine--N-acetylmuramyl-(pentapeptide) pyrophosphoryl-undecaprenol N-acetylglucosamine transferase n=1 Tax=Hyphobacterium lacteum TaxID=3116575 RepID=A0ABU7LRQ1_9PROT|nr:undecaprenyldiphospho-muramoylpentapeptide beta-N-acetylglucosaminyltransferase [Hyphobacterium sp. HN65]MEE2526321.1 undecaprenyldiphospho-muramoylpentapeptide beta-N-acetylglucosaminyltransferase [Hyphobacterium sp. HN65]
MPRRALIAAGGTGGHMFPARAAAQELVDRGWEVRLVTDARGMKHTDGFPAVSVDPIKAASPVTKNPVKLVSAWMQLLSGLMSCRKIIKQWKPDMVAGFGGYPAFPALLAAKQKNVPFAIHEQNAVLGRVNRVFAGNAAFVASGFDRLDRRPVNAVHKVLGNPVRTPLVEAREKPFPSMDDKIRVFVLGGSLGARILSETVPQAMADLPEWLRSRLLVAQQTREESLDMARDIYSEAGIDAVCEPFFTDVADRLAACHLVIARAGASSVSEIACVGRPAIFVPLAIAADDHQTANAEGLVEAGAADSIPERQFNAEALTALLEVRLANPDDLAERAAKSRSLGRPAAAKAFAEALIALA